jgi:hypothetical protein
LVDTSLHQIIRQSLARDRAKYAEDPQPVCRAVCRRVGLGGGPAPSWRRNCAQSCVYHLAGQTGTDQRGPAWRRSKSIKKKIKGYNKRKKRKKKQNMRKTKEKKNKKNKK